MSRTRLAPSPTGALHLGNARTFLVTWALARQRGWHIVLRIEDLDGPRVKPHAAAEAVALLRWLGLDWDEGPLTQRDCLEPYRQALRQLADDGVVYPCRCTRREVEAAALSAPHGDDHELRYPGTCRPAQVAAVRYDDSDAGIAWRVRVDPEPTEFLDQIAGPQAANVAAAVGDFIVATKDGLPSYQLAVVVDDGRQGIDCIVRGDDLLGSTHRQRLLQRLLRIPSADAYFHLPLVRGIDGKRLAKRHGDTRVAGYRELGTPPERVVGLLAEWCGLGPRREMSAREFLAAWDLGQLPPQPVVFDAQDDAWLRRSAPGR